MGGRVEGVKWEDEMAAPRGRSVSQQAKLKERTDREQKEKPQEEVHGLSASAVSREDEERRLDRLHAGYVQWLRETSAKTQR